MLGQLLLNAFFLVAVPALGGPRVTHDLPSNGADELVRDFLLVVHVRVDLARRALESQEIGSRIVFLFVTRVNGFLATRDRLILHIVQVLLVVRADVVLLFGEIRRWFFIDRGRFYVF